MSVPAKKKEPPAHKVHRRQSKSTEPDAPKHDTEYKKTEKHTPSKTKIANKGTPLTGDKKDTHKSVKSEKIKDEDSTKEPKAAARNQPKTQSVKMESRYSRAVTPFDNLPFW